MKTLLLLPTLVGLFAGLGHGQSGASQAPAEHGVWQAAAFTGPRERPDPAAALARDQLLRIARASAERSSIFGDGGARETNAG